MVRDDPKLKWLWSKLRVIVRTVLIIGAVLIALGVMVVTGFAKIESLWIVFPFSVIRISTVAIAIACFAIVLFLQRRNALKSLYYAFLAVIVPMASYEILWYYSAALLNCWDLKIMQFAALFGWVALGIREVFRKRPSRISIILYASFAVSFVVWLGTGFRFNDLNDPSFSLSAEVLNVVSKGALFIAFAFHIGISAQKSKIRRLN